MDTNLLSIKDLPLEILYEIVTWNPKVWRDSVISIPFVSRTFSSSDARKRFLVEKTEKVGGKTRVTLTLLDRLHGEGMPAVSVISKEKTTYKWYEFGILHRDNGPAHLSYDREGMLEREFWYLFGEFHRSGGPASLTYDEEGNLEYETWSIKDKIHREDGPAILRYRKGILREEYWYINDKIHKEDGPAILRYDEKGRLSEEIWCLNGLRHREDGPAFSKYTDGILVEECWYSQGIKREE